MTAKQYLRNIRSEQKELQILNERYETIYYSLLPSGIQYNKDNIQTSPEDMLSDRVICMTELQEQINRHIKHLEQQKAEALQLIQQIDDSSYRQVLILYYLTLKDEKKFMSWFDVAEMMGYSEDWIWHLHGFALQAFAKFYVDKDPKKL